MGRRYCCQLYLKTVNFPRVWTASTSSTFLDRDVPGKFCTSICLINWVKDRRRRCRQISESRVGPRSRPRFVIAQKKISAKKTLIRYLQQLVNSDIIKTKIGHWCISATSENTLCTSVRGLLFLRPNKCHSIWVRVCFELWSAVLYHRFGLFRILVFFRKYITTDLTADTVSSSSTNNYLSVLRCHRFESSRWVLRLLRVNPSVHCHSGTRKSKIRTLMSTCSIETVRTLCRGHMAAPGGSGGLFRACEPSFGVAEICRIFVNTDVLLATEDALLDSGKPYSIPLAPRSPLYKNITVPVVDPYWVHWGNLLRTGGEACLDDDYRFLMSSDRIHPVLPNRSARVGHRSLTGTRRIRATLPETGPTALIGANNCPLYVKFLFYLFFNNTRSVSLI